MKESGVLDTADDAYFFIMGMLMGNDIPRAIAVCVSALMQNKDCNLYVKSKTICFRRFNKHNLQLKPSIVTIYDPIRNPLFTHNCSTWDNL